MELVWQHCNEVMPEGDHKTGVICRFHNNQLWSTNSAALRVVSETHEEWAIRSQFIEWTYDTPDAREVLKDNEIPQ